MNINAPIQIVWAVISIYIYAALKDLSDGADDELQIFLYKYLSGMVGVLEKC